MSKKTKNRSQQRAAQKRATRKVKQAVKKSPQTQHTAAFQNVSLNPDFFKNLFTVEKTRDLSEIEQIHLGKLVAEIKRRYEAGERSSPLRAFVNAACDLMDDSWEFCLWEQLQPVFTLEQHEALPRGEESLAYQEALAAETEVLNLLQMTAKTWQAFQQSIDPVWFED